MSFIRWLCYMNKKNTDDTFMKIQENKIDFQYD